MVGKNNKTPIHLKSSKSLSNPPQKEQVGMGTYPPIAIPRPNLYVNDLLDNKRNWNRSKLRSVLNNEKIWMMS